MKFKYYTQTETFNNFKYIFLNNVYFQVLNIITFILVARELGKSNYGIYVSLISFFSIILYIGNLGFNQYSIRQLSISPDKIIETYNKLVIINSIMIVVLLLVSIFFKNTLFDNISIYTFLLAYVFQFVIQLFIDSFRSILQAIERMRILAKLLAIRPTILIIGTSILYFTKKLNLNNFLLIQITSSLLMLFVIYIYCKKELYLSIKRIKLSLIFHELKYTFNFLFGSLALLIFFQADKIMLAKLSGYDSVAIYNIAYKIVFYACYPVMSLMTVTYPKFFKKGNISINYLLSYIKKLIFPILIYTISAMILLFFFSFYLTKIFGVQYSSSSDGLRIMILILPLLILSFILGDFLTGINKQRNRAIILWVNVIVNIILNYYLITLYNWKGAIYATIISYIFLNVLYIINIIKLVNFKNYRDY
jgi:O-antigen/teichoic acid export membrane protein